MGKGIRGLAGSLLYLRKLRRARNKCIAQNDMNKFVYLKVDMYILAFNYSQHLSSSHSIFKVNLGKTSSN